MIDERFYIHRLKSTSLAGVVGGVLMGVWTLIQFYTKDVFRWDLMVILSAMAVVKLGTMLYFRKFN